MGVSPLFQVRHRLKIMFKHLHLKGFPSSRFSQLDALVGLTSGPQQLRPSGMGGFYPFQEQSSVPFDAFGAALHYYQSEIGGGN